MKYRYPPEQLQSLLGVIQKERWDQTTPQFDHQGVTKNVLLSITLKVLNISSQTLASEQTEDIWQTILR